MGKKFNFLKKFKREQQEEFELIHDPNDFDDWEDPEEIEKRHEEEMRNKYGLVWNKETQEWDDVK